MAESKFIYRCSRDSCNEVCSSRSMTIQTERFLNPFDENSKPVRGFGLGTWSCPVHGKTKVTRSLRSKS